MRRCLGPDGTGRCPWGHLSGGTRHPDCQRAWDRWRRGSTAQRGYGAAWQRFSRERVREVGYCQAAPCPYPDAGTATNPLTTDHVDFGLVLCRRCNSAKQHADRKAGGYSKK